MPQKAVPSPRPKVADAQFWNTAQPLHLLPEPGLGPRVEYVEFKLAQPLQAGARLQLIDGGQSIDLPHRRLCPKTVESE